MGAGGRPAVSEDEEHRYMPGATVAKTAGGSSTGATGAEAVELMLV